NLVKPLDFGFVETDVRVNDIGIISMQPRQICWPQRSGFAGDDKTVTPSPTSGAISENRVQYLMSVFPLFYEVGNANRARAEKPEGLEVKHRPLFYPRPLLAVLLILK